ncbi:membrane protein insertion efficiency factor YidD [Marinospirillum insulare]|uniref:Putative membrane protein insertion efficiency factor n=1 Tax=Marinospirillum insulare TaxID=217169 RepID=A0ABQ5ZWJ0_9GAMM|nr:hypothetical protein GCM10007878_12320 [Marinospirillum insulare]
MPESKPVNQPKKKLKNCINKLLAPLKWLVRLLLSLLKKLLVGLIRFYQLFISPLKPPSCRFYPTCSSYAIEAVQVHGPFKGLWLGIKRLGKCHPLHEGGVDLVPEKSKQADK